MAKEKLSAEEIKEKLSSAKEKAQEAKDALKAFCKENGLKKDEDHSSHEDEKIAKKFKALKAEVDEKAQRVQKWTAKLKETKKSGKGGGIKAKYTYPKDVTSSADKKKYRSETRSKAKRAGCTVEEYLADPAKYDKILKDAKKEKESKKAEKGEKKKKSGEEKTEKKKKKPAAEKPAATSEAKGDDEDGDDDDED